MLNENGSAHIIMAGAWRVLGVFHFWRIHVVSETLISEGYSLRRITIAWLSSEL